MTMTYLTLRAERRGPAAWVWMNRPEVHNAFDETLIADLTAAFAAVDADRNVRVIVLAGEGKSFSAGADLNWMQRQGTAAFEDNVADARRLADLYRTIALCETPTRSAAAWGWLPSATFALPRPRLSLRLRRRGSASFRR